MPRLLAFLPAEKVIIDRDENFMAIIGILGGLNVGVPNAAQLPADLGAPVNWYVLTIWKKEPEDEGRSYQQRLRLLSPSHRTLFDGVLDFQMTTVSHRNRFKVEGFPVAEQGEYVLTLSIKESTENDWRDLAEYPLVVSHLNPTTVRSTPR